ncbi:MAG: cache domain-containing protein [Minisyncoccia bacterium]
MGVSFAFLANSIHFALEITGAVAFLMAAWLAIDTYRLRAEGSVLVRAVGFGFSAVACALHALNVENDLVAYLTAIIFIVGYFLILTSFFKREELHMQAVLVLPAYTLWSGYLSGATAVLLGAIAYFSFEKGRREFNHSWYPFSLAFLFLAIGAIGAAWNIGHRVNVIFTIGHCAELIGFALLAKWVWQYLQLRLRESLVLIFISAALFLSTVVTLAFSTILISQITSDTEKNLLTNVQVLDLAVHGLHEEARAKTILLSRDEALAAALSANDLARLEEIAEVALESESLGFVTITDAHGAVLVRAHALSRRGDSLIGERAVEEALQNNAFVTIEESPVEKLSIRAAAPVFAEREIIGVVVAGYPLDNAFVDSIRRVTGLEMFIYQDESIAATALANDGRTRLTDVPLTNGVHAAIFERGEATTERSDLRGRSFLASYLPLKNGDGKTIGALSAAKPEQDLLDIENATNRLTLITVLLIMLVLAYPTYAFTRRLTEGAV